MKKHVIYCTVLALTLSLVSCTDIPGPADQAITNGRALVQAMHARYQGRWYENLCIQQKVTYYQGGQVDRQEVWNEFLALPGRVRSNVGDPADGNCEIYQDGAFHIFQDGKLARRGETVHNVLLLGFDVYVQDPARTVEQLEKAGFDLDQLHESTWQGQSVYVVGAPPGDQENNQFWIDPERLLMVRLLSRGVQGTLIEVVFDEYEPLEGGWIAMELTFKRYGQMIIFEEYLNVRVLDQLEPGIFDVETLKTRLARPQCE